MKAHRDLFPGICCFENLHRAFREARRGKRDREEVAAFEYDAEKNLLELQVELLDGAYRPSPYRHFRIRDPKCRKISAAPFRDRVVHHALCQAFARRPYVENDDQLSWRDGDRAADHHDSPPGNHYVSWDP